MSNDQTPSPAANTAEATYDDHDYEYDDGSAGQVARVETPQDRHSAVDRFTDDVRDLRIRGGRFNLSERTLMIIGGVIAPLGLLFIMLGWVGASRTPNVFEQIPYLISGGLFGLALVFLGAIFYFAHWLTELVRESRRQSTELIAAVGQLQSQLAAITPPPVAPADNGPAADVPVALVATPRGSMAHRPDCPVVADKSSLRAVDVDDDLAPCKLCDPYA